MWMTGSRNSIASSYVYKQKSKIIIPHSLRGTIEVAYDKQWMHTRYGPDDLYIP